MSNDWLTRPAAAINTQAVEAAILRQSQLTKPAGSLGDLESLAIQFAGWQGCVDPALTSLMIRVFAGDHGVCAQNISAFPQSVTVQMIANFLNGGAAISVLNQHLARHVTTDFAVANMGCVTPLAKSLQQHSQLVNYQLAQGSADFTVQPALRSEQLQQALLSGGEQLQQGNFDLFVGGEMGIGNTTSATAILAALFDMPVAELAGPGTGLDDDGVKHKIEVIERGLNVHRHNVRDPLLDTPLDVLRCLGGLEIAALVGSYIAAAQKGIPVLVDGFICTAAAALAVRINPTVRAWLLFSHCSAEPGHQRVLQTLGVKPLLNLHMRLGEGSGAAVAVPLIDAALTLHRSMATFAEAGVSDGG